MSEFGGRYSSTEDAYKAVLALLGPGARRDYDVDAIFDEVIVSQWSEERGGYYIFNVSEDTFWAIATSCELY